MLSENRDIGLGGLDVPVACALKFMNPAPLVGTTKSSATRTATRRKRLSLGVIVPKGQVKSGNVEVSQPELSDKNVAPEGRVVVSSAFVIVVAKNVFITSNVRAAFVPAIAEGLSAEMVTSRSARAGNTGASMPSSKAARNRLRKDLRL